MPGYTLIRSKHCRNVSITIHPDATIIVHASPRTPLKEIEKFVFEKHLWIQKKLTEARERPQPQAKKIIDGEKFLYLGESYPLKITDVSRIYLDHELYFPRKWLTQAGARLKNWYKAEAKKVIIRRVALYAHQIGAEYRAVKITNAQRQWGACTPKGNLCFPWRLIMAPSAVLDYIVVHEVAHLIELNHSNRFWRIVRHYMPDYKNYEKWLKDHERILVI